MKVFAIVCLALVAGVLAQDEPATVAPFVCSSSNSLVCQFQQITHHAKFHLSKLGNTLKDVGTNILASALDQGKNLLTTGSQAILQTVLGHMSKAGLTGRREIIDTVKAQLTKGMDFLTQLKDQLKAKFNSAVQKLTNLMSNVTGMQKIEEDTDKQLDDAVTEFKKDGKMGFFQMATAIKDKLASVFTAGLKKLSERFGSQTVEKRALLDLFSQAKDQFNSLVGTLADTFKPHMDALAQGVQGLADKAKEHGSNLLTSAKDQFDVLKGTLSGHLDTLKENAATLGDHTANAVNSLKEAIAAIVDQTAGNVVGTFKDGVSTILGGN